MAHDEHIWARVDHGRLKRMKRSEAVAAGYEIDDREGVGCTNGGGHGGVRREFMSEAERREVYLKTGVRCEDRDDMRKAMKAKGLREVEKGEIDYERFDAFKEKAEGGALDPRHTLDKLDLFGDYARMPKFDLHERYAYHRHRLGANE